MSRQRRGLRNPGGFTLVELLVVITIIGILIALLLPAVQGARDSARRTTCKNNLYQMGRASLQHVEKHGFYPTGGWGWSWIGDADRGFDKRQTGGWIYNILPFIEQTALHDLPRDGDPDNITDAQKTGAKEMYQTPLTLFICPSRRRAVAFKMDWGAQPINAFHGNSVGRTDYAAATGSQSHRPEYSSGPGSLSQGDDPSYGWRNVSYCNGISFERSEVRPAHVRDGESFTMMFGEKYMCPDDYYTGSSASDNENMYTGYNNDNYRSTHEGRPPVQDKPGWDDNWRFGSVHPVGVHFVFCDGAVHQISYSIDHQLYSYLGNRQDGQAISLSGL